MSLPLFSNFLFLISPWPYLCVLIYISVLINSGTRRSNSPLLSNFPNGNLKQQWSHIGVFICYPNIDAKKKIINFHIYGIHLLNPYKTVVSHHNLEIIFKNFVLENNIFQVQWLTAARAKMSLSRAQNLFMPANINSIVILHSRITNILVS